LKASKIYTTSLNFNTIQVRAYACVHTHKHIHNHFTALLDFVQDYPGEPAPER